jgi:K+-transporting ATPase ATPase C chain
MKERPVNDSTLRHIGTAIAYTILSVITLGIVYPLVITGAAQVIFPTQANGSMVAHDGATVGSAIVGQLWTKPQYFHGRPSAAGKGYDPTSTGATNLGPTSNKLIDAAREAIAQVRKENPDSTGPIPMDLITSSGSGIDPDISVAGALYQAPRVAKARGIPLNDVLVLIATHERGRTLGFLGEPRVNVLELNLALDSHGKM